MRVIFDTNVLITLLLSSNSKSFKAFEIVFNTKKAEFLVSPELFSEYVDVLYRKKFSKVLNDFNIGLFLEKFSNKAELIFPISNFPDCQDPNDNMLLNLVIDGKADCIITGDKLVLELNPFRGIPILNPSDFLDWIEKSNS